MRLTPPTRKAFIFTVFAIFFLTFVFPSAIHHPAIAATPQSYPPNPIPSVNVSVNTSDVFLGSNFTILATFDNMDTDDTGYGPFIDLYIPHAGEDGLIDTDPDPLIEDLGPNPPLDGIFPQPPTASEYTATYSGFALQVTTLTIPDQGADGRGCVDHPLALDTAGLFRQVCGMAGDQLVVIELPFGSFTPDQPAVTVEVPAFLSELASINDVLNIRARGGFQFGATPTVDWCCTAWSDTTILSDGDDADTWTETTPVNPSLVTIDKSSGGETPTGPNFPRTYTIEVDIATGQPVTNAQINDVLPANIIYQDNLTFNPTPDSFQEPNAGNGFTLQANYDSLTGVDGNDIEISFDYYLGDILNSDTGNPLGISNEADFTAEWVPIDPRDQEVDPIQVNPGPGVGTVTGVAYTSGKGTTVAVNQGDAEITPDDILRHTIHVVVSDYFALDLLQITEDVISDGHHFYNAAGYEPTLRVDTNGGSDTVDFDTANYTVTCNYSGGPGSECTADDAGTNDGTTTLTFDISQEMIDSSLHPEGQLLGGLVTDGGSANDGISEAWVTYYTVVLDAYTDQTGELSLDSNDSISNSYEFSGRLLDTTTCETPTPGVCDDDLGTTQTDSGSTTGDIPKMGLTKTLYAINGALCDSNPCDTIAPADEVTYRLSYTLVSGDFEQLTITDFLPLPIFHVDDPDEDGSAGPNWIEDTTSPVIPLSGYWMRGPNDTQGASQGIDPVTSINSTNNTLTFDFGTYSDTNNNSLVIDLLFTAEVSNDPFADGLRITNQAQQSDQNTSSEASTDTDIIQVTLTEPVLTSEKSAVSTDNPYVTANVPLPIIFTEPGHPEWGPWNDLDMDGTPDEPFNSEYLENNGGTVSADITGVDGNDLVKFAIIIQNVGSSENGAFDIALRDKVPAGYILPGTGNEGANLQVYRGDGTELTYSYVGVGSSFFIDDSNIPPNTEDDYGIRVDDPPVSDPEYGHGACQGHDDTNGKNVIIVTYDLKIDPNLPAGQFIENYGELTEYAGSEGGENHQEEPDEDDSSTTGDTPSFEKLLIGTEVDSATNAALNEAVIGEKITYQMRVTLPEGTVEDLRISDDLSTYAQAGLAFVSDSVSLVQIDRDTLAETPYAGSDITYTGTGTVNVTDSGQTLNYDFGTLTNGDNDNNLIEVLVIEYDVVVLNIDAIQSGDTLRNQAAMTYDTYTWNEETQTNDLVDDVELTDHADSVTVIEPNVQITKSVYNVSKSVDGSYDAGDTVRYTYVLQHSGSETDAFEFNFSDDLPYNSVEGTSKLTAPFDVHVTDSKSILTDADFVVVGSAAAGYTLQYNTGVQVDFLLDEADPRVITITLDAMLYQTASTNELFQNLGEISWTSMDGDVSDVSSHNTDSDERTGADGPGGALNDYADSDYADFNIIAPTVTKSLIGTQINGADNTNTEVVVGETVTYRLRVEIPEGELEDFRIIDSLGALSQNGLAIVSVDSVVFYDEDLSGNYLRDATEITYTGSSTAIITNSGRTMTINFGNLTNADRDNSELQVLYVNYTAVVLNVPAIQSGDNLRNRADVYYDSYDADGNLVDNQSIRKSAGAVSVIEPTMQVSKTAYNLTKSNATEWDAGDQIQYTYTIQLANNQTDAFDFDFWDDLPYDSGAGVSQIVPPFSISSVTDSASLLDATDFEVVSTATGYRLQLKAATPSNERDFLVSAARSIQIVLSGYIYTTPAPGETLTNTADITWNSMDGDVSDVSSYNNDSDERTGADGPGGALNDYAAEDSVDIQVDDPGASKFLHFTDQNFTDGNDLAIGEVATFIIRITLPEGSIPSLTVIDDLPAGLQYVNGTMQLITTVSDGGEDYSAYLTADFDGTLSVLGVNDNGGASGANVEVSFGAITVAVDNDYTDNSFLLKFDATLINEAGNQNTDVLTNNITTQIGSNTPVTGTGTTVDVVEPELDITKTVDDDSPIIGSTLEFEITIEHLASSLADAFELEITDVIPDGLTYVTDSASPTASYNGTTHTLTWDGGDLPNDGSTLTLTYQATVDSDASPNDELINDAVVTWTSLDGTETGERTGTGGVNDHINDTDVTVTVTNIDLAIEKDDGETTVTPGSTISYTINYYNNGNGDASGVEITETVPTYTNFSSADSTSGWSCSGSGDAGDTCTFSLGTLRGDNADDGSITFAVTMDSSVPNDATQVVNTTSIAEDGSNGPEPTTGDNQDSDTDTIDASVDISISKTDGVTDVDAGDPLTYTLTVTNEGDRDALDVYVTDVIPDYVLFSNASDNPDGAAATYTSATRTVTWPAFDLDGGDSVNLTVVVDVLDPFPLLETYTITNQASVVNADDTNNSNNSDNDVDNVDDSSALYKTIVATNEPGTSGTDLAIGETATYALRFTLPEGTFNNILINDNLPAGMDFAAPVSLVTTAADSYGLMTNDCASTLSGYSVSTTTTNEMRIIFSQIVNDDGDPNNNTCMITFNAVMLNVGDNQNGDTLTNTATITIDGGAVLANASADVTVVEPELTVTKESDITNILLGQTATYTITVEHTGNSTENAYDVIVTDVIPSELTYIPGSMTTDGGWTMEDSGGTTLIWSGDLPLGNSVSFTYQVEINSSTATPGDLLTNNVNALWTSLDGNQTYERNGSGGVNDYAASTSDDISYTNMDIYVTKDDGVSTTAPGDVLSYTITYGNSGNSDATNVVLTETVPDNTTFNAANSSVGWICAGGGGAGDTCMMPLGTLLALNGNASAVLFAVTVNDTFPGSVDAISNTASIADDGTHGTDPTPANNTDTDTDTLNAAPDIRIQKDDGLEVVGANSTLTYTLTVENAGTQDAAGVSVKDTLPAGASFVSAGNNPDGAAASYDSGTHSVTWPDFDLSAGANTTLTVTVLVDDPLPAGTMSIFNMAEAHDDGSNGTDTDNSNNTATDEDRLSTLSKSVIDTSEITTTTGNGVEEVTIGEIITYQMTFEVPNGSVMSDVVLQDTLGLGLTYLDCVSITPSGANLTTDVSGTPSNDFSGVCSGAAVTDVPDPANPGNVIGQGRRVTFNFGNVANTDVAIHSLTVTYRTVALDVPENVTSTHLENDVIFNWGGGQLETTGTPELEIVEPDLTLTKEIDRNTAAPGTVVTYTLRVSHTNESRSDAFDVVMTDILPAGLEYVPGSLTAVSGPAPGTIVDNTAPNLQVVWPHIARGQVAVVSFQATVIENRHGVEVVNSANVGWSSLPGDISAPQSPYNPTSTERAYDPADLAGLYTNGADATFITPALPETGFAPGVVTRIPEQPDQMAYTQIGEMQLEIPSLGVAQPVTGIPLDNGAWDLTWLWNEAGYLEGTAFPGTAGNSAITGHVYLPNGAPGPFVNLHTLTWGDKIVLTFNGQQYIYEVREVRRVTPDTLSVIDHQENPWLTLITCQGFQKDSGQYAYRIAVKAVLVQVTPVQ